jgi:hypothetical protein
MTKGMLDSSKSPLIPPVRTSGTIAFRERGGWQIEGVVVIFKAPFSNSPTGGKGLTVGSAPPSLSKKGDTEGFFVIWLDTDLRRNGEEGYRQGRLYNCRDTCTTTLLSPRNQVSSFKNRKPDPSASLRMTSLLASF